MDESTLRITYSVFFFLFIIVSSAYRIRATKAGGDSLDVKKEGMGVAIPLRIAGSGLTFGSLIFIFFPEWISFADWREYSWFYLTGVILCAVSLPFVIWTFQSLGKNITETVEARKASQLVTTGIYKYLRHPIYTTTFFFNCGLFFISANLLIGALTVTLFVMLIIRTTSEEKILIEKFGDNYRDYMRKVGGHFPRPF